MLVVLLPENSAVDEQNRTIATKSSLLLDAKAHLISVGRDGTVMGRRFQGTCDRTY